MHHSPARGLRIAKSPIDGHGCFAVVRFRKHQRIAEYVGERISGAEAARRQSVPGKKRVCDVDLDWSIDGSRGGNGTQYVNHSCEPNAQLTMTNGRLFLYATRKIFPGEEITAEYLYELRLDDAECRCQTATCVGKDLAAISSSPRS
jgi:SET domain-containing protein